MKLEFSCKVNVVFLLDVYALEMSLGHDRKTRKGANKYQLYTRNN